MHWFNLLINNLGWLSYNRSIFSLPQPNTMLKSLHAKRTQRLSWPSIATADIWSEVVGRLTCLAILQSEGADPEGQVLNTVPSDVPLHEFTAVVTFTRVLHETQSTGYCWTSTVAHRHVHVTFMNVRCVWGGSARTEWGANPVWPGAVRPFPTCKRQIIFSNQVVRKNIFWSRMICWSHVSLLYERQCWKTIFCIPSFIRYTYSLSLYTITGIEEGWWVVMWLVVGGREGRGDIKIWWPQRTQTSPNESTAITLGTPTPPGAGTPVVATAATAAWFAFASATAAIASTVAFVVRAAKYSVRAVVAAARASLQTMYAATFAAFSAVDVCGVPAETAAAVNSPAAATLIANAAAVAATLMAFAAALAAVEMASATCDAVVMANSAGVWAFTTAHNINHSVNFCKYNSKDLL